MLYRLGPRYLLGKNLSARRNTYTLLEYLAEITKHTKPEQTKVVRRVLRHIKQKDYILKGTLPRNNSMLGNLVTLF